MSGDERVAQVGALTVEEIESHLDAMGWDRPRAMAEDLAPLMAERLAAARADERKRISAALNAVMRWRVPHPAPNADAEFDYMLLLVDVEAALHQCDTPAANGGVA